MRDKIIILTALVTLVAAGVVIYNANKKSNIRRIQGGFNAGLGYTESNSYDKSGLFSA